jgi:hypothetical protein
MTEGERKEGHADPWNHPLTLDVLALKLNELEKRVNIHREYQTAEVRKAAEQLDAKLVEMNEFRKENRDLTAKFATSATLDDRVRMLETKIQSLDDYIAEGLGKRLTAIEMYKANIDGRFWVWGVLITVITLFLQFWPLIRGK